MTPTGRRGSCTRTARGLRRLGIALILAALATVIAYVIRAQSSGDAITRDLRAAIAADPSDYYARRGLVVHLAQVGNCRASEAECLALTRTYPARLDVWRLLRSVRLLRRDFEGAVEACTRQYELARKVGHGEQLQAADAAAAACIWAGDIEAACQWAGLAAQLWGALKPDAVRGFVRDPYWTLAVCKYLAGNYGEAREALRRCLPSQRGAKVGPDPSVLAPEYFHLGWGEHPPQWDWVRPYVAPEMLPEGPRTQEWPY